VWVRQPSPQEVVNERLGVGKISFVVVREQDDFSRVFMVEGGANNTFYIPAFNGAVRAMPAPVHREPGDVKVFPCQCEPKPTKEKA